MNFISLAKKRYSCRSYLSTPVEEEKLSLILEAARVAPTAANIQPQQLIVVQSEEGLRKLRKAANFFSAPLVIITCGDTGKAWVRPMDNKQSADIDASIVTDHMMLEATDLGLNTLWICYFKPDILKAEFHLPANLEPINLLAIGYGADTPAPSDRHDQTRKPLNETVRYE